MSKKKPKDLKSKQPKDSSCNASTHRKKTRCWHLCILTVAFIVILIVFFLVTLLISPFVYKHCSYLITTIIVVALQMLFLYALLRLTSGLSSRYIPVALTTFLITSIPIVPVLLWGSCSADTNCAYTILVSYVLVFLFFVLFALSSGYLDKKLFDPYLPGTQPIRTVVRNMKDYLCYWLRQTWQVSPVKIILIVVANMCALISLHIFTYQHSTGSNSGRMANWMPDWLIACTNCIRTLMNTMLDWTPDWLITCTNCIRTLMNTMLDWTPDWLITCINWLTNHLHETFNKVINGIPDSITLGSLLIPLALDLYLFSKNFGTRFNHKDPVDELYEHVDPPESEGWTILTLTTEDSKVNTYAHFNSEIDKYLQDGETDIRIVRNKEYEKILKEKICNEELWKKIFLPFLRQNYLESIHMGKQFYNEKKYGLSEELDKIYKNKLDKDKSNKDESPFYIGVHKTCYFDSYLTNIIPGHQLVNNQTGETVATTDALMPYLELDTTDNNTRKQKRQLLKYNRFISANEPGITTLLFVDNTLLLWRQNHLAQSSVGKLVASGSGSADWKDCKEYLGEKNGLYKAVIKGMQRELWEESHGDRNVSKDEFMDCVQTRITGYFRWLKKGGKAEFVGITRIKPDKESEISRMALFSPEPSEVQRGKRLDAHTMYDLRKSLKYLDPEGKDKNQIDIGEYNVSCAMALYKLKLLCEDYCKQCGGCPLSASFNKNKKQKNCAKNPADVLFEDEKKIVDLSG